MIDYKQLENYIEALYSNWNSCSNATMAFMMASAHESKGGTYIFQNDGDDDMYDTALGINQIQKNLHDDVVLNAPNAREILAEHGYSKPDWKTCLHDIKYSALIFRLHFMRYSHKFPSKPEEMAVYLKKYWNTEAGAATPVKYLNDWISWKFDK